MRSNIRAKPYWLKEIIFVASLILGFGFGHVALAQEAPCCWINAETGKSYPSSRLVPQGTKTHELLGDPNHVYIPPSPDLPNGGGLAGTWVRDSHGTWVNAATGTPYPCSRLVPQGTKTHELLADPNHVYIPPSPDLPNGGGLAGTWVRVPCPPETAGHTIRNILQSVSVGVNISGGHTGGDDRRDKFHHDDRHLTDTKLHTDQKKATDSSDKKRVNDHKKPSPTPTPR